MIGAHFANCRQIPSTVQHLSDSDHSAYNCGGQGGISAMELNVIIERDSEGNYVASVPALRGCHTQAKWLDEVMSRIREAAELCLEDICGANS